jgi:hypothetical protein
MVTVPVQIRDHKDYPEFKVAVAVVVPTKLPVTPVAQAGLVMYFLSGIKNGQSNSF